MAYNHAKGMCYLYEDEKICFIPIPKNSSTTVRKVCPEFKTDNFLENPSILEEYETVCIVRNPIDRFCSAYMEIISRAHGDGVETRKKNFISIQDEPKRFYHFIDEVYVDGFF